MKRVLMLGFLTATVAFGDGALTPRGVSPRLLYTDERVHALAARLGDAGTAAAWSNVLAQAAGGEAEALGLAYRVTGDKRYAAQLRDRLLKEVRKPTWSDPALMRRDPPWHAGLEVARQCKLVALGFDALHDFLGAEERREIAGGLVKLGIEPALKDWLLDGTRIHALDTMGHNWWSACVFSAGLGCLAMLDEEPRAADWLRRISAATSEWFGFAGNALANKPATFDRAGGFYESVNYANFALSEYLLFRLAWRNALSEPTPEIPLLEHVGDFFLQACYPNGGALKSLNFGDGSLEANGSRAVALLWANGIRAPGTLWYLRQTRDTAFREGISQQSPLGLLYLPSAAELDQAPPPELPRSALFRNMGWGMLRTSWEQDATLLATKCGTTWNHAHADNGSFVLFHRGEYLLIDSGNCAYGRPEYDDYYRQGAAHNVVLLDGEGENRADTYFGSKFAGTLDHLLDDGDVKYLLADATGPNARRFLRKYRHFLWIGDVILVVDDVQTYDFGQLEWLLHPDGEVKREGLDLRISKGAATVRVRPLFPETFPDAGLPTDYPEKMRLEERDGLADHDPDEGRRYYALLPAEPERREKFVTAILLETERSAASPPAIERLRGNDWIGVRVRQGPESAEIYLNLRADGRIQHRNGINTMEGWETDALLTAVIRGERPRFLLADGSYLRRAGASCFESLTKSFVIRPLEERP